MSRADTIFVQVASYRDSELEATIKDLLEKASHPERLTFGICIQDERNVLEIREDDKAFKIVRFAPSESRGPCWARYETQKFYAGERFTLQIDSHMRFIKNWDALLIKMWKATHRPKAILSSYPPSYTWENGKVRLHNDPPQKLKFARFELDGVVSFAQAPLLPEEQVGTAKRGRFLAAGFLFTRGSFIEEVPYDPKIYFLGEEISLSLRAFTQGYDLMHPIANVMWHLYVRSEAPRHWTDHDEGPNNWKTLEEESRQRLKQLLVGDSSDFGKYGLGSKRTRRDYEIYTGIHFARQLVHPNTLEGLEPPSSYNFQWEREQAAKARTCKVSLPPLEELDTFPDLKFIYVGIHDHCERELCRRDISVEQYRSGITDGIDLKFYSIGEPRTCTVWPFKSDGWASKHSWPLANSQLNQLANGVQ